VVPTPKHHWIGRVPNPKKYFGFIYEITCLENGRKYIGKKQYWVYKKRKQFKENNWHDYTGSSKELNEDIKRYGKGRFEFKILKNVVTRGGLTYTEAHLQHKRDVLTKPDPRCEGGRLYYNKQIGAIRFIPKEW
jgi:hypothetical protein